MISEKIKQWRESRLKATFLEATLDLIDPTNKSHTYLSIEDLAHIESDIKNQRESLKKKLEKHQKRYNSTPAFCENYLEKSLYALDQLKNTLKTKCAWRVL